MRHRPRSARFLAGASAGQALIATGLLLAVAIAPVAFAHPLYDDFTLAKQSVLLVATALVLVGLALEGSWRPRARLPRAALLAWSGWLVVACLAGIDRRGSLLGYYQYRQGFLTQVAYVALFLGALSLARRGRAGWIAPAGLAGLAGAFAYTAIQGLGLDPLDWWIETSERAIGTVGNANELAAYAVIALALCGAATKLHARARLAAVAGIAAAASFTILQAESRSGLIALVIAIALFPAAAMLQGLRRRETWSYSGALAAGALCGLALSFPAGAVGGTANRVASGIAQSDTSTSTRLALWEGTASTIAGSPVVGYGPDGLHLAFPRHRPAVLGGEFEKYDMIAQSSHNWLLDTAASAGLVGLAALLLLLGSVAVASIRNERPRAGDAGPRDASVAFAWSAMAAYFALALMNPLSLAAHALFFVLLGILAGRAERLLPAPLPAVRTRARLRAVAVAPAALSLVAVAVLLPIADLRADQAWGASVRGDFRAAAGLYADAAALVPFEPAYARREAEAWLAAGVNGDADALARAERAFQRFDDRFVMSSDDAVGLATARIGLREPPSDILPVVERALALNPNGVGMQGYAATLRDAASIGGVLHYSALDRWVYVDGPSPRH